MRLIVKNLAFAIVLLCTTPIFAGAKLYDAIEFQGLKLLSKESIATTAGVFMQGGKFAADPAKIEEALKKEALVRTFKLIDKNNRLTIVVSEREIRYLVAVESQGRTRIVELDETFTVASRMIHRSDLPLVVLSDPDVSASGISRRAQECLLFVDSLRKKSPIWKELESVTLRSDGLIDVMLRGRSVIFTTTLDLEGFQRLSAAAGWCDRMSRYPARMFIRNEFTVAR